MDLAIFQNPTSTTVSAEGPIWNLHSYLNGLIGHGAVSERARVALRRMAANRA